MKFNTVPKNLTESIESHVNTIIKKTETAIIYNCRIVKHDFTGILNFLCNYILLYILEGCADVLLYYIGCGGSKSAIFTLLNL